MFEILSLIAAALFNLLTWIAVALCLVLCAMGLAFWILKLSDWIQAVRHARRLERVEAARAARKKAERHWMGPYSTVANEKESITFSLSYIEIRPNEFNLEKRV